MKLKFKIITIKLLKLRVRDINVFFKAYRDKKLLTSVAVSYVPSTPA